MHTDKLRVFAVLEIDNYNRIVIVLTPLIKYGKLGFHQHQ
jgi:hypothetical protein